MRLCIFLTNGAAEMIYNVVFEKLNIKRSFCIDELYIFIPS